MPPRSAGAWLLFASLAFWLSWLLNLLSPRGVGLASLAASLAAVGASLLARNGPPDAPY